MKLLVSLCLLACTFSTSAQGVVSQALAQIHNHGKPTSAQAQCGSHFLMQNIEGQQPGFLEKSNSALQQVVQNLPSYKQNSKAVLTVPIVFHVVYNNPQENLPETLLQEQLTALNNNFNRLNADTANLRSAFLPYAGNPHIRFELATVDPNGNPTNGITRTSTNIAYFGDTLPYAQNQQAQIEQWVDDNLFNNLFRLTSTAQGGIDAWDPNRYFNVWIGDLRLFMPLINNFEELLFIALATPPLGHPNFAGSGLDTLLPQQGVLMHYVAVGPNNPNSFPPPYGLFNTALGEGDILAHEAGHYLGLRHIWGDGDCTFDDFIDDTPRANNSGQFGCNTVRNTCVDTIGGLDLEDMAENFMDYSSDACANSFTAQQANVMRATLFNFRPNLFTISQPEFDLQSQLTIFPNPTTGQITLENNNPNEALTLKIFNPTGQLVKQRQMAQGQKINISLEGPKGLYLLELQGIKAPQYFKVIKN